MAAALLPGEVAAIDGKTVRRSLDRRAGRQAIHLVSAWAPANTLTLGQVKTEKQSNEITAIARLLETLELNGRPVTIDAMGRRKEIAREIVDRGADCLLAVKQNQGQLDQDVRYLFEAGDRTGLDLPHDYATTLNKGHGRIERRECRAVDGPIGMEFLGTAGDWPRLRPVVKVESRRETESGATTQARYYISSLAASAERQLAASRAHWSIENSLHWSLDVTLREDKNRVREDHGPQNMATLRRILHNLRSGSPAPKWAYRASGCKPSSKRTNSSRSSSVRTRLPCPELQSV